ncbi:MAG: YraN family protein [Bergeyella sp.]|nr:YraN family protein [Bergeyella sp.]
MTESYEFGKIAEKIAVEFLVKKGYFILKTNYRSKNAELDIIALYAAVLVIVEVKARSQDVFQQPQEAVDYKKRQRILSAAHDFVLSYNRQEEVRFDIITVLKKHSEYTIQHIEDAFGVV